MPLDYSVGPTPPLSAVNLDTIETRLEAINLCLRAVGYTPVETEDSGDLDAEDASKTLATVGQRVQYNAGKGWWFNNEDGWEMTPDANGAILAPNNAISGWQDVQRDDLKARISLRGRSVYDMTNHTFDLTKILNKDGFLRMGFIMNLPFEHMPVSARQVIAYQAAVEFMTTKEFDVQKITIWQQIAQMLQNDLGNEQASQYSFNMFVNNPTQAHFGNMAGGPNADSAFSRSPWNGYGGYHRRGR